MIDMKLGFPLAIAVFSILVAATSEQTAGAAATAVTTPAATGPDPVLYAAGAKVFADNCAECHSIAKQGAVNMGPNLHGLMGQKAGMQPEFAYSDAIKASNVTWTPEALDKWLTSPPAFIPDNVMPFVGLKNPADRAAVIAYVQKRSAE